MTGQHLAIIASWGSVYPAVAIMGALKICTDTYVVPRQLEAAAAKSGGSLVIEGMEGIAPASVVAVLAFQTLLLFLVMGPHGLLELDGFAATPLLWTAALLCLPAIVFGRQLATLVPSKICSAVVPSGVKGYLGGSGMQADLLEEGAAAAAAEAADFARAYEEWREKQTAAAQAAAKPTDAAASRPEAAGSPLRVN